MKYLRIIKLLALLIVMMTVLWLSQTASSEPADIDPNESIFLPLLMRSEIMLKNGTFEEGRVHWEQYSSNSWWLIVHRENLPIKPHNGAWEAWLGGDYNEDSILWQEVTIPKNNPILIYWLWIDSVDLCGYDIGGVTLDVDDVVDVYWLCDDTDTGGWIKRSINLNAFAGNTVDLEFSAFNDESLISNVFIDDVSLGSVSPDLSRFESNISDATRLSRTKEPTLNLVRSSDEDLSSLGSRYRLITSLKNSIE